MSRIWHRTGEALGTTGYEGTARGFWAPFSRRIWVDFRNPAYASLAQVHKTMRYYVPNTMMWTILGGWSLLLGQFDFSGQNTKTFTRPAPQNRKSQRGAMLEQVRTRVPLGEHPDNTRYCTRDPERDHKLYILNPNHVALWKSLSCTTCLLRWTSKQFRGGQGWGLHLVRGFVRRRGLSS